MKEIEVNNLGMQEMDTKSMKEVNGGFNDLIDYGPALRNRPSPTSSGGGGSTSALIWWAWGLLANAVS